MAEFQYQPILLHWQNSIGQIISYTATHNKETVFLITNNVGKTWILKKIIHVPTQVRLLSEYKVLNYLYIHGVPVSVPLLTDSGDLYVEFDGQISTVSPALSSHSSTLKTNDRQRYLSIGRALGHFHSVIATYPYPIESWTMNLPRKLEDEIIPFLEQELDTIQFDQIQQKIKAITPTVNILWEKLPTQTIHGDFHGGNVLFDGQNVVGFIDLDHIPIGARVYDLSYFLADEVKNRIYDTVRLASWLASYNHLIIGYSQVSPVTLSEKSALWLGMLISQLLFIDWFVKSQDEEHITKNIRVFNWIYDHQQDISIGLS